MKKPLKNNKTENKSTEQERERNPKGKSPIGLMNNKSDSKKSERGKEEVKRGN